MGIYLYTIKKKTVEATQLPENKQVTVALATYTCKIGRGFYSKYDDKDSYRGYAWARRIMTRAQNLVKKGFNPDFFTTDFKRGEIYKFKGIASVEDTPDLGERCGKIVYWKGKYYVVPAVEYYRDLLPK